MVDIELILEQLRSFGHTVTHTYATPANADDHEFIVDGETYTLQGVRDLLTLDAESGKHKTPIHP
jgi:hypothetical protein